MQVITAGTLALQLGSWGNDGKLHYSNQVLSVCDLEDASRKWGAIRDHQDYGSSDCPVVQVVNTVTSEVVAKVSYNGRVWDTDGNEIRIGGRKTAAEHEAEGWKDCR